MDERGWLQRVALALFPEIAGSKSAKFLVHERREVIEGLLVTLRPLGQESCHLMGGRITHLIDDADLEQ
jgi:hypothetical protein